jgi:hypothetical protein
MTFEMTIWLPNVNVPENSSLYIKISLLFNFIKKIRLILLINKKKSLRQSRISSPFHSTKPFIPFYIAVGWNGILEIISKVMLEIPENIAEIFVA